MGARSASGTGVRLRGFIRLLWLENTSHALFLGHLTFILEPAAACLEINNEPVTLYHIFTLG